MELKITMKLFFWILAASFANYLVITTTVNAVFMGVLFFRFSFRCRYKQFVITKKNRTDFQDGNQCAAFSSAYVLRHWGIEAEGDALYENMTGKTKDGCVYPSGIRKQFMQYGFCAQYCTGNQNALKNEISKGNPVIVMLRSQVGQSFLHYVPVVGYDENNFYVADSWNEFANCEEKYYNRRIEKQAFQKLWNTGMVKMPLYRNTYFVLYKS